MAGQPVTSASPVLSFSKFLELITPSEQRSVLNLFSVIAAVHAQTLVLNTPDLDLYCKNCDGKRVFRSASRKRIENPPAAVHVTYECGNCRQETVDYSLFVLTIDTSRGAGEVYKFGQYPYFSIETPRSLEALFGKDKDTFRKGRDCEAQGLGIAAFAYYRRIVEDHKNDILDKLIAACQTAKADTELIEQLIAARAQKSFQQAIETIKAGLPDRLLIGGHNPLTVLHSALSEGLHNLSDAECLANATAIRVILTELAKSMTEIAASDRHILDAISAMQRKKVTP